MIYRLPLPDEPLDQGDVIEGCPLPILVAFDLSRLDAPEAEVVPSRVLVLTQTCDLANRKATAITIAVLRNAQELVEQQILKPADIRGPIRAGRVYGLYYLPKN